MVFGTMLLNFGQIIVLPPWWNKLGIFSVYILFILGVSFSTKMDTPVPEWKEKQP